MPLYHQNYVLGSKNSGQHIRIGRGLGRGLGRELGRGLGQNH